jgi:hypothetical protein
MTPDSINRSFCNRKEISVVIGAQCKRKTVCWFVSRCGCGLRVILFVCLFIGSFVCAFVGVGLVYGLNICVIVRSCLCYSFVDLSAIQLESS